MAKVNAEIAKRLKAMGIKTTNEDDARKELLAMLKKEGIEGMEDEDTDVLIEMAESFQEDGDSADAEGEEEVPEETEAESEDEGEENPSEQEAEEGLAEEAAEEEAAEAEESEEEEEPEPEAEEEEPEQEGDEYDQMDRKALKKVLKDNGIGFKVYKSTTDDEIRNAIRTAMKAREDAGKVKPKKAAKKTTPKAKAVKLNPKANDDDKEVFYKALGKLFPKDKYNYAWVSSAGVTIKAVGKNFNRGLILIENASVQPDKSITCNLYFLTMGKKTDVLDAQDIEYAMSWNNLPFIKHITLDEVVELVTKLFDNITEGIDKLDKRLGESRKKMEETLKKTAKKSAPKAKKAEPEFEAEEEEEPEAEEETEEEEAPKPKKAAVKKTAAKKAVKKAKK